MIAVVEKNDVDRQEPPTVIKIGVTRSGANALARMAKKYGMQKQEIGGRIYDWFMAQDDIVQRGVLGLLEGLEVDAAARFMQRLAEDAAKKPPNGGQPIANFNAITTNPLTGQRPGYIYVKPARRLRDIADPFRTPILWESLNAKADPNGAKGFADWKVER